MPFAPKDWHNAPDTTTPLDAAGMEDLETRLADYVDSAIADAVASLATVGYVDSSVAGLAPLDSPALTGTPTAPTPTHGDNDTSVATTAFVQDALAGAGGVTPLSWTAFAYGTSWRTSPDDWFTAQTVQGGRYAKDDYGMVHLDGMVAPTTAFSGGSITLGTGGTTNLITTLPAGFRPAKFKRFVVPAYYAHTDPQLAWIEVFSNGEVRVMANPDYTGVNNTMDDHFQVSLDGIRFPTT